MQHNYTLQAGAPHPLGATPRDGGVNFALYSEHATAVTLCLFDEQEQEIAQIALVEKTHHVWHVHVGGLSEGAIYGYRVDGDYAPVEGHRFNPNKLLLDPYAKSLAGELSWEPSLFGYDYSDPAQDLSYSEDNSAELNLKGVVVALDQNSQLFNNGHNRPDIAWADTVIYELHVKGFTALNSQVPEQLRGTYLGLGSRPVIEYLKSLGVTAVELLPVHSFVSEQFLHKRQLTNYWGYNTVNFFTPHAAYAIEDPIAEFKTMVASLHEAGIEVILDVVYNHTAEGSHLGPHLSFKGIDNATYYALHVNSPRFYANDTGCGNTLNVKHPKVLQMVLDSLRHWVTYYGVDGFRFDLASVLGRESYGFDKGAGFFDALMQDPILSTVKLIAEPWDIGPGGYQLGQYPPGWSEWNDQYRDIVRRFWRGDEGLLPEFARRIHGSSDVFEHAGRQPSASINFVTSHDGFTLRDLVSYNQKHNHANKESNNDGHHANFSFNFGVEGPTKNARIETLRLRQQRNFLATLILSQGTPMILAGDELGRTQNGNNNAYCQDNAITWVDWALNSTQEDLIAFVKNVLKVRRDFPLLRSKSYIHKPEESSAGYNIHWLSTSGEPMTQEQWQTPKAHALGWMLESVVDAKCEHCLLTLFNAGQNPQTFKLPKQWHWVVLMDTTQSDGLPVEKYIELEADLELSEKSMLILYGMSKRCELTDQTPLVVT